MEPLVTISPSTNQPVLTRLPPSDLVLRQIPAAAQQAFLSYRNSTLAQRQKIVAEALDALEKQSAPLAAALTTQMGRPTAFTGKELSTAVMRGRYLLRVSSESLADAPGDPEAGFKRYIRKCPVGPVLILFAWNYPYLILVNALIPALLAGNSVILKPAPQTPTIVEHIRAIFAPILAAAGFSEDTVQFVHTADPAQLHYLAAAKEVQLVCFTGAVARGLDVQRAAAGRIVPVSLELGGKDPALVRADVDVEWAAEEIVDGAVFNSGQSCCSIERVYVHASVHDRFIAACKRVLAGYRLGDPTDPKTHVGPVISKAAKKTIEAHIADALHQGAKDETPENDSFASPPAEGNYVKPTLLTHVTHDMTIMTEETFGPVIPVMAVHSDEEAVRLMNDSQFGLTASVWTKDVNLGEQLAQEIEAGTVFVNRADYPAPDLAWTGWKDSGKGVTLSKFGFDQFVRLKSVHVKAYPGGEVEAPQHT